MPQLKPTRGIRLNKSHHISRGLVGCWLFNEGSGGQVFDLSGNGHILSFVNSPTWTSGKYGSSILFDDGSSQYLTGEKPSISSYPITMCCWFNSDDIAAGQALMALCDASTNNDIFMISARGDQAGDYIWAQANSTVGWANAVTTKSYSANTWHLACGVFESTALRKAYIDGGNVGSDTTSIAPAFANIDTLSISVLDRATNALYMSGKIDHVMIWNRALTDAEIALLYREPFCMFERAWIPKLIGGQIVELAGSSVALSSSSATAKAMRKVGGNVVGTSDVTALLNLIHSLLYIERNWLREALFNGMTANAFKLGTTLSLGWFWVRVAGCSVLYRGSSMEEIDFVNILAVAEQDAREISPPSYISHNSGSTYFYVVRRFNDCGYQERTLAASVKVSIESNGELAEPQPNKVFDSGAELVDGNKILLVWYYCPLEQKSQPMCFNVYYDGRTGQINYENPLAIIGYKGREFYRYQCGALAAGRYLFAIRTEDASGIENSSLARLRIQFEPTNPAAIDILSVEGV